MKSLQMLCLVLFFGFDLACKDRSSMESQAFGKGGTVDEVSCAKDEKDDQREGIRIAKTDKGTYQFFFNPYTNSGRGQEKLVHSDLNCQFDAKRPVIFSCKRQKTEGQGDIEVFSVFHTDEKINFQGDTDKTTSVTIYWNAIKTPRNLDNIILDVCSTK